MYSGQCAVGYCRFHHMCHYIWIKTFIFRYEGDSVAPNTRPETYDGKELLYIPVLLLRPVDHRYTALLHFQVVLYGFRLVWLFRVASFHDPYTVESHSSSFCRHPDRLGSSTVQLELSNRRNATLQFVRKTLNEGSHDEATAFIRVYATIAIAVTT